jgi:hypothetical protein
LPRLRPLRHRQGERQHAVVIARDDVLGVDRRTETELATKATLRSLGNEELVALVWLEPPFRPDGEDLILDRDFDRLGVDAGQVEVDDERVASAMASLGKLSGVRPPERSRSRSSSSRWNGS